MNRTIGVGVLSGVLGGLVLDGVMRVLSIHTPGGSPISMIGYLGTAIFPPDTLDRVAGISPVRSGDRRHVRIHRG